MKVCIKQKYIFSLNRYKNPNIIYNNTIEIEKEDQRFNQKKLHRELEFHKKYLLDVGFVNDNEIISASGDETCILWDIEKSTAKTIYADHKGDVTSIDINKQNTNLFVSGSIDAIARIWDIRTNDKCIATFRGNYKDIDAVKWFVDGQSFITGCQDGYIRLFDMRSLRQLNEYINYNNHTLHGNETSGVTCVDVSKSGSYIFAGYDNGELYMWSTLKSELISSMPHDHVVSALEMSPNGYTLATGCWDFVMRTYA